MSVATLESVANQVSVGEIAQAWSNFASGFQSQFEFHNNPNTWVPASGSAFDLATGLSASHPSWFTPVSIPSSSQYMLNFSGGQAFSTASQYEFNFSGLSSASHRWSNIQGWGGVGFTAAGAMVQLATAAIPSADRPYNSVSYWHNLAGEAYGATGGVLGTLLAMVILPETLPVVVTVAASAGISMVAAGAMKGLFNMILPPPTKSANALNVSANVGGILLDKCAVVKGILPQIGGAYWDSSRGVLVLHGPEHGVETSALTLIGVEFDHLLVALRAALAGEHIGVSIDPPSEYRDGIHKGVFPPAGTPMYVSYLGNTEGTLFGAIMFEADRIMKCLSKGADNVTGRSLRANKVPGYGSLFELFNQFGTGGSGSWFRFWFVIDTVEIAHDSAAKALRFGNVRIKVLNETELWNSIEGNRESSTWFSPYNIVDLRAFAAKMKNESQTNGMSKYLSEYLSIPTRTLLSAYKGGNDVQLRNSLVNDLNSLIQSGPIFDAQRFAGVEFSEETQRLLNQHHEGPDLVYLNRILITDAFSKELSKNRQDPACAAFAQHLTEHYDEYAKEFPVFARLKEIDKISALARFLVKEGIALDSQTIFKQPILPVATPERTPGICVSSPSCAGGYQSLFGGVDMNVHPVVIDKDDELALSARDKAQSARPSDFSTTWSFIGPEGPSIAFSMKLGSVKKPYRALASSDHAFQDSWRSTVRSIQRFYDSSIPGGDFGPGWWLFVPYRLKVIPPSRKRPEVRLRSEEMMDDRSPVLILHNFVTPGTEVYRRHQKADNADGFAYCRVTYQDGESYSVTKTGAIRYRKGSYFFSDGKYTFRFNEKGELRETRIQEGVLAAYMWSDHLLVGIDHGGGRSYEIRHDQGFLEPRISEIVATDGSVLTYNYDENGLLHECIKDDTRKVSYRYDRFSRISETRDGEGIVVKRNAYDAVGNIAEGANGESWLSDGTKLQWNSDLGRISVVKDESGSEAQYSYRKDGSLASISARSQEKGLWTLEYDEGGRLVGAQDSQGVHFDIFYHPDGQVRRVEGNNAFRVEIPGSDEKRKELTGVDANGVSWSVQRNDLGLPETIIDSNRNKHQFRYDKNGLKSIKSPGGLYEVVRNNGIKEFRTKLDSGIKQTLILDRNNARAQLTVEGPEKGERRVSVEENGYIVQDCAGTAEYRFDNHELVCEATYTF